MTWSHLEMRAQLCGDAEASDGGRVLLAGQIPGAQRLTHR
jgi:hypothetical protein